MSLFTTVFRRAMLLTSLNPAGGQLGELHGTSAAFGSGRLLFRFMVLLILETLLPSCLKRESFGAFDLVMACSLGSRTINTKSVLSRAVFPSLGVLPSRAYMETGESPF